MNKLRIKLNKIFSKNPDFVFYDYDNECVGDDLLELILTLQKSEHQRGFIEGSDITGRIAEEVNACERQEIIEIIEKMRFYNQDYELEVWIKKIKKDIIKAITNK